MAATMGLGVVAADGGFLTRRGLEISVLVAQIAAEIGSTPSRVALAWTLGNPAVAASLVGARTVTQLEDNLGALEVRLDQEQWARLDQASAVDLGFPHETLRRLATTSEQAADRAPEPFEDLQRSGLAQDVARPMPPDQGKPKIVPTGRR
jgi:hypothetical protein